MSPKNDDRAEKLPPNNSGGGAPGASGPGEPGYDGEVTLGEDGGVTGTESAGADTTVEDDHRIAEAADRALKANRAGDSSNGG